MGEQIKKVCSKLTPELDHVSKNEQKKLPKTEIETETETEFESHSKPKPKPKLLNQKPKSRTTTQSDLPRTRMLPKLLT